MRLLIVTSLPMCYVDLGMRRLLTIFVLVSVGCGLVAPAAWATASDDTPICCRRDGKHHCHSGSSAMANMSEGMSEGMSASTSDNGNNGPALSATSPRCPMHPQIATSAQPAQTDAPEFSAAQPPLKALLATTDCEAVVSELYFANSERGPPPSR